MSKKPPTPSTQLRDAIKASTWGTTELAVKIGVDKSTLSLFINGKRGISIEKFDELCRILNLELTRRPL